MSTLSVFASSAVSWLQELEWIIRDPDSVPVSSSCLHSPKIQIESKLWRWIWVELFISNFGDVKLRVESRDLARPRPLRSPAGRAWPERGPRPISSTLLWALKHISSKLSFSSGCGAGGSRRLHHCNLGTTLRGKMLKLFSIFVTKVAWFFRAQFTHLFNAWDQEHQKDRIDSSRHFPWLGSWLQPSVG